MKTGVIALGLCGGSKNDGWMPLNKNLWSPSFVFTTACFGAAAAVRCDWADLMRMPQRL